MTITIASISIGIAVDDTIHYIHRFREEYLQCGNYILSMRRTHHGVGVAMFYTSITIICGFMLLVFSDFIPSVLFGVLSSVSMLVALLGALTLLPRLLIIFKPFGKESK
jgi:predicted RND superfamily exporter protein